MHKVVKPIFSNCNITTNVYYIFKTQKLTGNNEKRYFMSKIIKNIYE